MYDVLIRNGLIYDGTGSEPFTSDIAVFGDRIALIGKNGITRAKRVIDASGRAVFPGFIDIHTHTDLLALRDRDMTVRLSQGITTDVSGNCGIGVFPVSSGLDTAVEDVLGEYEGWSWKDYRGYRGALLGGGGIGINEAFLVSHTAIRLAGWQRFFHPYSMKEPGGSPQVSTMRHASSHPARSLDAFWRLSGSMGRSFPCITGARETMSLNPWRRCSPLLPRQVSG